jgi:hypothetical protein
MALTQSILLIINLAQLSKGLKKNQRSLAPAKIFIPREADCAISDEKTSTSNKCFFQGPRPNPHLVNYAGWLISV